MPVRISCPKCKKAHLLADDSIGRSCRCSQCETVFKVASGSSAPSRTPTSSPAPAAPAASSKPAAAPQSKTAVERSVAAAAPKQKQAVPEKKAPFVEPVDDEPAVKKTAPPSERKGVPWPLVLVVAFVFFVVGGAAGYLVSRLTTSTTPSTNTPLALAPAKDRETGSTTAILPVSMPSQANTDPSDKADTNKAPPVAGNQTTENAVVKAAPTKPNPVSIPSVKPAPARTNPVTPTDPPAATGGPFILPTSPGGWAMTPDNVTLIVSIPYRAQLIYFDTVADKEIKRVSLDFKPADIALRGTSLMVIQKGASVLHILDADSGKQIKEIRVPGEPLDHVACGPQRGPVFVSNAKKEIYAIDPDKGTVTKSSAMGQFVAVDPAGAFLYTGTQDPIRDQLVIRRNGSGARVSLRQTGRHASIMKYDLKSGDATLVAANGNASINGAMMCLSPDGKRIALPGGGGWESLTEKRRSYSIPIWDTKNLETMLGQVELGIYPRNVAFHPVLNLGAADKNSDTVVVFNGKSLAEVKSFKVNAAPGQFTPFLLTFGGKGSKVIYASAAARKEPGKPGVNFDESPTQLHFLPLDLSAQDKATLDKAYNTPGAGPVSVTQAEPAAPAPASASPAPSTPAGKPEPAPSAAAVNNDPPAAPGGPFALPTSPGGWAMTPDNVTLIVSIPSRAELIYFDTVADKEIKHVSLDFQPAALALRGKSLVVAQKGASLLHVLDADSGKQSKEIRVPGEPLENVACGPERGLVFVSNAKKEVYAINPDRGAAVKTSAMGQFLAVSPDGKFLYTGTQDPIRDQLVIRRNGSGARVSFQQTGRHASIMKYAVKSGETTLVSANGNASINGTMMCLSPDGKRIALPGGGGWESLTEKRRSYSIPIWDTKNLETMLGQVELGIYPRNVAFHPVLNLGAADKNSDTVVVFNGKSLAEVKNFKINVRPGQVTPFLLTFGGKGSKVIYASASSVMQPPRPGVNFDQNPTQLHFLPLDLSADDKAALEKAYSKP